MKKHKSKIFSSILLCMTLCFTGCSANTSSASETPYYSISIDGRQKYKSENDEAAMSLTELTKNYVYLVCDINYKDLSRSFEELDYYTDYYKQLFIDGESIESANESYEYAELVQSVSEVKVSEIYFYELYGNPAAKVYCDYKYQVSSATDEYLVDSGIELNKNYKRQIAFKFEKENNQWKISDYDFSTREEV